MYSIPNTLMSDPDWCHRARVYSSPHTYWELFRSHNSRHKFYAVLKSTSMCLQIQIEFSNRRYTVRERVVHSLSFRYSVDGRQGRRQPPICLQFSQTQCFFPATISLHCVCHTHSKEQTNKQKINVYEWTEWKMSTRQDNQNKRTNWKRNSG